MNQKVKTSAVRVAEHLDSLRRIVVALSVFAGLFAATWTQFLGPGIKPAVQDFVGTSDLYERMAFVELYMPPPPVVEWNEAASRQIADCRKGNCRYMLTGARTDYGRTCGRPIAAEPFLRTSDGRNVRIRFDNFEPVELTTQPTSFILPLDIPSFVDPGLHQFRVRLTYPTCPNTIGATQRWTPWFPINLAGDDT
ncbi:MAG: hypothetical protein AAFU41_00890 [Pseudomonadota bacterium]